MRHWARYMLLALSASTMRAGSAPAQQLSGVGDVSIVVSDLEASRRFYADVLSFSFESEHEESGEAMERRVGVFAARARSAVMSLGAERIRLVQYLAPEGAPIPRDSRSNDLWFQHIAIVVSDMDQAYARLREHHVRHASSGPQTLPAWNPNAGGIRAFYFKDPDGHVLEIIQFPQDKGDPRWRTNATQALFLGIDHTAIVVDDTDRSLEFYRDTLGLRVVGASENHGIEQERLNSVFGARLRITTLRAEHGPGVELLEYLAPEGGRDYPADASPNDLIAWTTTLMMPGTAEWESKLRTANVTIISSGVAGDALLLRDPDGHLVAIEPSAIPQGTR